LFRGNPQPGTENCGFEEAADVHMGWLRTNGCPGTPEEILGAWTRTHFIDTNAAFVGTPYAAIGLNISMTEVGAYDPEYGDFALLRWQMTERNGNTVGPVYAGTHQDWDVPASYLSNWGIVSDNFNGVAVWDAIDPGLAYGFLDPRMKTGECGVVQDKVPHRIQFMGRYCEGGGNTCGAWGLWQQTGVDDPSLLWEDVVNGVPRLVGPFDTPLTPLNEDKAALLINEGITFQPYGTDEAVQAKFAVPAGSNDEAAIEALAVELARRAAIWAGYARGDANMDGCVDVIDACWIAGTNQIYPDYAFRCQ
jgi:hypothetical protein